MPRDIGEPPSGSSPVPPDDGDSNGTRPDTTGPDRPVTLTGLLEALTSLADDAPAAQGSSSAASPLELPVTDALLAGLLWAIRKELGNDIGDLAQRSLSGKPLTRRTARRVLQAALTLAAARKTALASAGLPPTLDPGGSLATPGDTGEGDSAELAKSTLERRVRSRWLSRFEMAMRPQDPPAREATGELPESAIRARAPQAAPPLEEVPNALIESRHAALLEYCLELVRKSHSDSSDPHAVTEAAQRLHDRVREFLEKRGRWPLADAEEYEEHAKPIAVVLAAWD